MSESMRPFVDSTPLLVGDPVAVRQRMADDGYLYLRGLASRDQLMDLRREMLDVLVSAGWIKPPNESLNATWSGVGPFTEGEPQYMAVYQQIINTPVFRTFADQSSLVETMGKILNGKVLAHRLRIGRVTFPSNTGQTTAAHQDFHYIRGTAETYTIWTPVGDCPVSLGGLAVLRGSHRGGFIEHDTFPEKKYANRGLADSSLPTGHTIEWHAGDFVAGDVLIFHSHTVHKALPNLTKDQLRLSTDNRYTRVGDEVAELSTKSHYEL